MLKLVAVCVIVTAFLCINGVIAAALVIYTKQEVCVRELTARKMIRSLDEEDDLK